MRRLVIVLTHKEVAPCHVSPAMSCQDGHNMLFKEVITVARSLLPMKTMDVSVIICKRPVLAITAISMHMFL